MGPSLPRFPARTPGASVLALGVGGHGGVGVRGSAVNQVPDVEYVVVIAGMGVPTSGLILGAAYHWPKRPVPVVSGPSLESRGV